MAKAESGRHHQHGKKRRSDVDEQKRGLRRQGQEQHCPEPDRKEQIGARGRLAANSCPAERKANQESRDPAQIDGTSGLQRFGADDLDVSTAHLAPAGNEIDVADGLRRRRDDDVLAAHGLPLELARQDIGRGNDRDRPRIGRIVRHEGLIGSGFDTRKFRSERRNLLPLDGARVVQPPDGILIIVPDADHAELDLLSGGVRQHVDRCVVIGRAEAGADRKDDGRGLVDRLCKQRVIRRGAAACKVHVEEDPVGAGLGQLCRKPGVMASRPGPLADFAKRSIVDRHEHNVAAGVVNVSPVAHGAEEVFRDLTKTDQPEDERGHRCPKQQFPAGRLTLLRPAQAHRARFL